MDDICTNNRCFFIHLIKARIQDHLYSLLCPIVEKTILIILKSTAAKMNKTLKSLKAKVFLFNIHHSFRLFDNDNSVLVQGSTATTFSCMLPRNTNKYRKSRIFIEIHPDLKVGTSLKEEKNLKLNCKWELCLGFCSQKNPIFKIFFFPFFKVPFP